MSACRNCALDAETHALEKLLISYKALAENGGWPEWKQGKAIKPSQHDSRIPTLRQILTITGDYPGSPGDSTSPTLYNESLIRAVRNFQSRHGLTLSDTLSKPTQQALAVPIETRIRSITETLARLHSRPISYERKFILVNLPAFSLYAMEQNQPTLTMRVIIGNRKNHTPLFDSTITHVVFNPQWHVPKRIARNELAPKLRTDPNYFIHAGFVVTHDGMVVDPLHPGTSGDDEFSFRQLAGDENALGKVKFDLPDTDDIYLHSTSSPRLFAKDDRALSHGCVRVQLPRELTHFVLRNEIGWDAGQIDKTYDASRERFITVDENIPVHLVYWTALVDTAGKAYFYNDIYGKDNDASGQHANAGTVTLAAQ